MATKCVTGIIIVVIAAAAAMVTIVHAVVAIAVAVAVMQLSTRCVISQAFQCGWYTFTILTHWY